MFNKHKQLFAQLDDYYKISDDCLKKFRDAMTYAIQHGLDEHFELLVEEISQKEQNCDDLRRTIEHTMFAQSLLPETREDIIMIIEMMDQIPNHCESVSFMVVDQRSYIFPGIKSDLIELLDLSVATFELVVEAARDCLNKMEKTTELVREIDDNENVANSVVRKMIRSIFTAKELESHPGRELIQKEIVKEIQAIMHLCKHLSEKIMIAVIKRHV